MQLLLLATFTASALGLALGPQAAAINEVIDMVESGLGSEGKEGRALFITLTITEAMTSVATTTSTLMTNTRCVATAIASCPAAAAAADPAGRSLGDHVAVSSNTPAILTSSTGEMIDVHAIKPTKSSFINTMDIDGIIHENEEPISSGSLSFKEVKRIHTNITFTPTHAGSYGECRHWVRSVRRSAAHAEDHHPLRSINLSGKIRSRYVCFSKTLDVQVFTSTATSTVFDGTSTYSVPVSSDQLYVYPLYPNFAGHLLHKLRLPDGRVLRHRHGVRVGFLCRHVLRTLPRISKNKTYDNSIKQDKAELCVNLNANGTKHLRAYICHQKHLSLYFVSSYLGPCFCAMRYSSTCVYRYHVHTNPIGCA